MNTKSQDGVLRQAPSSSIYPETVDPDFYESDDALRGYYDTPRPTNDNAKVYRSVRSRSPYHCYNSTSFKYVDVALPRVSFIDGPVGVAA